MAVILKWLTIESPNVIPSQPYKLHAKFQSMYLEWLLVYGAIIKIT